MYTKYNRKASQIRFLVFILQCTASYLFISASLADARVKKKVKLKSGRLLKEMYIKLINHILYLKSCIMSK